MATTEVEILWVKADGKSLKGNPSMEEANEMGLEVNRIREECGGVGTSRAIVYAAMEEGNPLHGQFEWDMEKAAWAQWIKTANDLLHSFQPVETEGIPISGLKGPTPFVAVHRSIAVEAGIAEPPGEDEESPDRFITLDRRDKDDTVQMLIARQDVQEVYDLLPRVEIHNGNNGTPDMTFLARAIRKAARLTGILP